MPKAKQKTKHLNESQILEFLDSGEEDEEESDDDDIPPVPVEDDFVPDEPVDVIEEVIYENNAQVSKYRTFIFVR